MRCSLLLPCLTACVVALLVACGGGPPAPPPRPANHLAEPPGKPDKDPLPAKNDKEPSPPKKTPNPRFRDISPHNLRENKEDLIDALVRVRGRAVVGGSYKGRVTLIFPRGQAGWFGVAMFLDRVKSNIDPVAHKGQEFDVVLEGVVGIFGDDAGYGQPEHGFHLFVSDVIEAKPVAK